MSIKGILAGHFGVSPRVVALARGVVEAAVMVGLEQLAINLSSLHLATDWQMIMPVAWLAIRWLEGEADQKIDPSVKRMPETTSSASPPSQG